MKGCPLSSGNISKDFTSINIKKAILNGYVYQFSFDYNINDTSNIIYIHKYFIKKKKWYKMTLGIFKKCLSCIVNAFD